MRGDRDVNEIKLKKALSANQVVLATDAAVKEVTGAPVGFAGPVGLKVPVYCDVEVCAMSDFVVGANEADAHLTRRQHRARLHADGVRRLPRRRRAGDACARCDKGHLKALPRHRGRPGVLPRDEILEADGRDVPGRRRARRSRAEMGCYGIGVTRIVAAAIEQSHDKDGIIWPVPLAPFEVAVLDLQQDDPAVVVDRDAHLRRADGGRHRGAVRRPRRARGREVQGRRSDRLPFRIAVGKKGLAEGVVEVKRRNGTEVRKMKIDEVVRRSSRRSRRSVAR